MSEGGMEDQPQFQTFAPRLTPQQSQPGAEPAPAPAEDEPQE